MPSETVRLRSLTQPPRPGTPLVGVALILALGFLSACGGGYHHYAGPLRPVEDQGPTMAVADDGGVTYVQGRLEVRLRPLTDDELNRQFSALSTSGPRSTNPYTFGDQEFYEGQETRQRFTVFSLGVKNYAFPKVRLDPTRIELAASNGRTYWSLRFKQLQGYYRAYAIGYRGNEYSRFRARQDLLLNTMLPSESIFSGQEVGGFVVFPALHPDVDRMKVIVHDVNLRFDYRNEPIESVDIVYEFVRDVGRLYTDGTVELTARD